MKRKGFSKRFICYAPYRLIDTYWGVISYPIGNSNANFSICDSRYLSGNTFERFLSVDYDGELNHKCLTFNLG